MHPPQAREAALPEHGALPALGDPVAEPSLRPHKPEVDLAPGPTVGPEMDLAPAPAVEPEMDLAPVPAVGLLSEPPHYQTNKFTTVMASRPG